MRCVVGHITVELSLSFVPSWRGMRVHRISETIVAKSIHGFCYAYVVHGVYNSVFLN